MKVDGITLLQMIKDGNVNTHTKIKFLGRFGINGDGYYFTLMDNCQIYLPDGKKYDEDKHYGHAKLNDLLDYDFEIELIEEPKQLPSKINERYCNSVDKELNFAFEGLNKLANKYNELIDYLSSKERDE